MGCCRSSSRDIQLGRVELRNAEFGHLQLKQGKRRQMPESWEEGFRGLAFGLMRRKS
jgi:hypothetical protein